MRHSYLVWIVVILAMLTQFTNCDIYTQNATFKELNSQCAEGSCNSQGEDLLELRINAPIDYPVSPALRTFDIGGDCNEGGYTDNVVTWKLSLNNAVKYESQLMGLNGRCVNGRFALFVDLRESIVQQHVLEVEIIGLTVDGQLHRNAIVGKKTLHIKPL